MKLSKDQVRILLDDFYSQQRTYKTKGRTFSEKVISSGVIDLQKSGDGAGLGDSIILTAALPHVKINNSILRTIGKNRLTDEFNSTEPTVNCSEISESNWGGGHCTQRIQRALGLEPSIKPSGKIKRLSAFHKNRVFVHLATHTDWKRQIPNTLDDRVKSDIFKFFNQNLEYNPFYFNNNLELDVLTEIMESCEFFLGIDSGPMHLAAALELKSIIVINSPSNSIMLPKIRECEIPNSEWLYPQNIHLNTLAENPLVPNFSLDNLRKAFRGEIYPYWSDEYLSLYFERNFDFPQINS